MTQPINLNKVNFPAFVTLSNGKSKLHTAATNAYSWAKSMKADVVNAVTFDPTPSANHAPSNEAVKQSYALCGGKVSDFVAGF